MAEPTFEWVSIDLIEPNPWNPNVMAYEMYAKAIESIHEFGFVNPITVRTVINGRVVGSQAKKDWLDAVRYQIIDGEHRWRAGKDHGACVRAPKGGGWERHGGLQLLPITNLGDVPDEEAQQLTIVLNETRGTYDPKKMGALLVDLIAIKPLAALTNVLPFDKARIEELAELPSVDWEDVSFKAKRGPGEERMVERVYRLPIEAADALDRAIQRCREDDGSSDAQALQTIAQSFLRS